MSGALTTNDYDAALPEGSHCAGFVCAAVEIFETDAIILKGPNLRLQFEDTSLAAGALSRNSRATCIRGV